MVVGIQVIVVQINVTHFEAQAHQYISIVTAPPVR